MTPELLRMRVQNAIEVVLPEPAFCLSREYVGLRLPSGMKEKRLVAQLSATLERDLGADSLDRMELAMALEAEFGPELKVHRDPYISEDDAARWQTVGDVVAYIATRVGHE